MRKRGQVFLIATVVIISILIGFTTIFNQARVGDEKEVFYELSEEIEFETKRVLDYGTYNSKDTKNITENFLEEYANYIAQDEVVFIFGNSSDIDALVFRDRKIGSVGINTGGVVTSITIQEKTGDKADVKVESVNGKESVILDIDDINYRFDLKEGQNFFFVINKEEDNEKFVAAR